MLDIKYIIDHKEAVKENIKNRFMQADIDALIDIYQKRNEGISRIDQLRQKRNENAAKMKGKMAQEERQALIEEGKQLKIDIAQAEEEQAELENSYKEILATVPNMAHPEAPIGKEDKDNTEIKRSGTLPQFDFKPKDHLQLGEELKLIDFDTAAKVSGAKFYYLLNEAVILELALVRYAMDILRKKEFTLSMTPDIARQDIVEGIGFNPRGAESNIYTIEDTDTCLVGTAEITLGGYFADQIISTEELPLKMAGFSHCFRKEAGAAGQYSKGLYRVHQFSKVEMFVFCQPSESEKFHQQLLAIEEEIFQGLEIPYRVVDTCTGDLGAPAYRKFDLEAWMPGRGEEGGWGEITSTSNCTDYQARRLKIRYKNSEGKNEYLHMLNGTAIAVSRAIIALLENHQQKDGSIRIPEKLRNYTGFSEIRRSK